MLPSPFEVCLSTFPSGGVLLVLLIPVRGRFIRPFGVAGEGGKYFFIASTFMQGIFMSWLFTIAFIRVVAGKLKND